jgi:hypothetical protein
MRKLALALVVGVSTSLLGANLLITEAQSYVCGALEKLKFDPVPAPGGVVGGPQRFRITQKTIDFLRNTANSGKTIVVENDGSITIK